MNTNTRLMGLLALTLAGTTATAKPGFIPPREVPRGSEIQAGAAGCGAGPIGQINKAGRYNEYCTVLTEAEKCLAFIKNQMYREDFNIEPVTSSPQTEIAAFCVEQFKKELLGE